MCLAKFNNVLHRASTLKLARGLLKSLLLPGRRHAHCAQRVDIESNNRVYLRDDVVLDIHRLNRRV